MEQNLETKSECGDIRKTKPTPDSKKTQPKKPKDDLPCNSPLAKDPTTHKSACKSNNLIKTSEDPIATVDSLEINKPTNRKNSIMSFGNDPKGGSNWKEQLTPSLDEENEKGFKVKRKNSLDQVHK